MSASRREWVQRGHDLIDEEIGPIIGAEDTGEWPSTRAASGLVAVRERLVEPEVDDAAAMWALAGDAGLDRNSRYAYLVLTRDFAGTSIVARDGDGLAGFVIGYRRPSAPRTLFVWQVAVAADRRRRGLGQRMLDALALRLVPRGVRTLEATVTPSNRASARLFRGFAAAWGTEPSESVLFPQALFEATERDDPGGHETEVLFRIGPLDPDAVGGRRRDGAAAETRG